MAKTPSSRRCRGLPDPEPTALRFARLATPLSTWGRGRRIGISYLRFLGQAMPRPRPILRIPTLASVPANSSDRVSLDRYQDLDIDLRECSITKQKRVARPRDRSSEVAELHNQWVNEGEGEGQGAHGVAATQVRVQQGISRTPVRSVCTIV